MNNPLRILQTFDRHLAAPAELTVFGRGALALGYPNSPAAFAATRDVDAILPLQWLAAADENRDFWQAWHNETRPSRLCNSIASKEGAAILRYVSAA